jgi:hypothetical protein
MAFDTGLLQDHMLQLGKSCFKRGVCRLLGER